MSGRLHAAFVLGGKIVGLDVRAIDMMDGAQPQMDRALTLVKQVLSGWAGIAVTCGASNCRAGTHHLR